MILLKIIAALIFVTYLPTFIVAVLARQLGVIVKKVNFGVGSVLLERGQWALRVLPLSASVSFMDTRTCEAATKDDLRGAFDQQKLAVRIGLALSGPVFLLICSIILIGPSALDWFAVGFSQIMRGAIFPFSSAQTYLSSFHHALVAESMVFVVGLMAAKFAAFNLLPAGGTGTHLAMSTALLSFFPARPWLERLLQWLVFPLLFLWAAWLLAIFVYVMDYAH